MPFLPLSGRFESLASMNTIFSGQTTSDPPHSGSTQYFVLDKKDWKIKSSLKVTLVVDIVFIILFRV